MNMQRKVTPISLYFKDLRRINENQYFDKQTAAIKYKSLSIREKDFYEVSAKRLNENSVDCKNQKDTFGISITEVSEIDCRIRKWEESSINNILTMASSADVLNKEFVAVKVSGVNFCKSNNRKTCYATSEICFLKFSFMRGIIDKLILFPDFVQVAPGYRESVYEDLEVNVGWRPETFRNNHSIEDCVVEIRNFLHGIYEPIFAPTKDHQMDVGLALDNLYREINMVCPWIESFDDWGTNCKIYQLEYLISSILIRNSDNLSQEDLNVSPILYNWRRLQVGMSPESCERHELYGEAKQCATNTLLKVLYGSFMMVQSPELPHITELVSQEFFKNIDFIMPPEKSVEQDGDNAKSDNFGFEKFAIEDVLSNMRGIRIQNNKAIPISNIKKRVNLGRGRGLVRRDGNEPSAPGSAITVQRKLKLPSVVC